MAEGWVEVGRVAAIFRYPVKSMRGEPLREADVWWHGLVGDRKWAFVHASDTSGFPWLTGRDVPAMIRYAPRFADAANPLESPVVVRAPDGRELPLDGAALRDELAAQAGGEIFLVKMGRGCYDSMTLSLISDATLRALGEAAGVALEPQRFRPNILVEPLHGEPFAEEAWVGGRVRFGERPDSAVHRLERRNVRCMMVNLDPETARQTPQVLRAVVRERDTLAGIYGSTEQPGTIRVGDTIRLIRDQR